MAEALRPYAPPAAQAFEVAAQELEQSLRDSELEALTLEAAEVESGYSLAHLRRLIREGSVPNAGTKEDPRILRKHLPRKPGHGVRPKLAAESIARACVQPASSPSQVVRAVASGGQQ